MDFLLGIFLGAILTRTFLNWLLLEDIKEKLEEMQNKPVATYTASHKEETK